MLKQTEETIVFFVTFLSFIAFQLGGPGPPPLATLMVIARAGFTLCRAPGTLGIFGTYSDPAKCR